MLEYILVTVVPTGVCCLWLVAHALTSQTGQRVGGLLGFVFYLREDVSEFEDESTYSYDALACGD